MLLTPAQPLLLAGLAGAVLQVQGMPLIELVLLVILLPQIHRKVIQVEMVLFIPALLVEAVEQALQALMAHLLVVLAVQAAQVQRQLFQALA